MKTKKIGLYIHIPFCRKICPYCDFFKMVASLSYQDKYIDYLIKDFNSLETDKIALIDTIYIGGGTPSCLSVNNLDRLLKTIINRIGSVTEFTIELNPEDIDYELIRVLRKYPVNRISIGIQTFNKKFQSLLNRYSDFEDILEKMNLLRLAGFTNINVDLMYGFADETLDDLMIDLEKMCLLRPTHISTYSLILEEKTIFYHEYIKGNFKLIDEDLESLMYYEIIKYLTKYGFEHYEISNFALSDFESKHNLTYWQNREYLAIGASASGYYDNYRYKITPKIIDYYRGIDNNQRSLVENEYVDFETKMDEEIMLGLRLIKGICLKNFSDKFGRDLLDVYPNCLELIDNGFLEIKNNYLRITANNYYISNAIIGKII